MSTYNKAIIAMCISLAVLYLLSDTLNLNYPLGNILTDQEINETIGYRVISEYLGFMCSTIIDFLISLGLLYLFFKMGEMKAKKV